jgi:hypothetical protein
MNAAEQTPAAVRSRFGERFTLIVLLAMTVSLGYLRFVVFPKQENPEALAFEFVNPMLDARPGERVLFTSAENLTVHTCSVVRPEGVVLRPAKGPERIGQHEGLRQRLPFLACSIRGAQRAVDVCGGSEVDTVLYALNYFGMPADTKVRVDWIRPRWMKWGERNLVVYEVVFERYCSLGGRWTTYLSDEAPVAGLVKWSTLLPQKNEVYYRPVSDASR